MKLTWWLRPATFVVAFATVGAVPARAQTFGGSATGVQVTVPATGTVIRAATGTVPIEGGGADAALLVGDIPGSATGGVVSLAVGTVHSAITGLESNNAEASMANIVLTVSGNQITADFLMARGAASCPAATSGSTDISNLVINGQPITLTGDPNQTVALPNGSAIINQYSSSIAGSSAAATVYGLHVTTTDAITHQELADVVLGAAQPQIDCQAGAPPNQSFGTGGGWVVGNSGGKANFGVVGGDDGAGGTKGHVTFQDKNANVKVKSTEITMVDNSVPCQSTIYGVAEYNGISGIGFTVEIQDHGEPGKDRDHFRIDIAGYTNADQILNGGNIQKHKENCN